MHLSFGTLTLDDLERSQQQYKVFICQYLQNVCKINTETFTLVIYPGFGHPQKPFEFGSDQTMVIRLISLMSNLLKGPISWKRYQIGIQLLLTLDRKS